MKSAYFALTEDYIYIYGIISALTEDCSARFANVGLPFRYYFSQWIFSVAERNVSRSCTCRQNVD